MISGELRGGQDSSLTSVEAVSEGRWNSGPESRTVAFSQQVHKGSKYSYHCALKLGIKTPHFHSALPRARLSLCLNYTTALREL